MAISSIIKKECPTCKKIAVEASRMVLGATTVIKLECGHNLFQASSVSKNDKVYEDITFSDGKKLRPYQIDAVKFAENSDFNCIIADEQGLGKTIELLSIFRLHYEKLFPAVLVVPTNVKIQWLFEINRICCPNNNSEEHSRFLTQVIQSTKERALPGFQIYIVTFDMLKKENLFEYVPNIKTIVIDECQRIKNHLSDRAKAVQRIAKDAFYHIPMSGTPIKNNAGEYFTVLNLVAPTKFPHYQRYLDTYCDTYETGWAVKVGGLKDPERFHADTSDLIIRRTKLEVLKDLPSKDRKFFHANLDPKFNKAYAKALEELFEIAEDNSFSANADKIAIIGRLRHIVGISKVDDCIEFLTEFLLSTDRKITVFTHHTDVADMLKIKIDQYLSDGGFEPSLHLSSQLNAEKRHELVMKFRDTNSRVLIASTQAAGEGLNLQFCSDAVMLERQWNPANEEQAEDRFHRFGQLNNVSITYMIASGTIDEYFTELVEQKRAIVASTLDNKTIEWDQQTLMAELVNILVSKGAKGWRL